VNRQEKIASLAGQVNSFLYQDIVWILIVSRSRIVTNVKEEKFSFVWNVKQEII
jgi:hypothetical protein